MLGAIIGDIVGSRFEFIDDFMRPKNFALFTSSCHPTDDSLMTLAVAEALLLSKGDHERLKKQVIASMKKVANKHPNVGWGERFHRWLFEESNPQPYNSYGNGAGMRISPVGWVANSEDEVRILSQIVTEVSHNHPEGIKGAEAIAMAVYLARIGKSKNEIRGRMQEYYPELNDKDFTIKNTNQKSIWQWLTGVTLFYKDMDMDAPVRFKEDGINKLILGNINGMFQGMPAPMNTAKLEFKQKEFDLSSKFELPVFGAAMYHQSQINAGRFTFTAGLRLDYERAKIDYVSTSAVDYIYSMKIQMSPMMPPREIKVESGVNTTMGDKLEEDYFELLPKFALQYSLQEKGNLYASVTRGFKAGGYNTQIFSDILQNKLVFHIFCLYVPRLVLKL